MVRPQDIAFLIGAMKSGTTSLWDAMALHPQVCRGNEKEPKFFSRNSVAEKGLDWYLGLWPDWDAQQHKIAIDASTSYAKSPLFPDAAKNIFEFNPEAKLIYLVRHPLERIRSQYQMGYAKGWGLLSLSKGIDQEVLYNSMYRFQLAVYEKYFPGKQILVITHDDLNDNPAKLVIDVCNHLGIETRFDLPIKKIHTSGDSYDLSCLYRSMLASGFKLENFNSAQQFSNYLGTLPHGLLETLKHEAQRHYTLSSVQNAEVHEALKSDMKKLQEDFGINVARWGF